MKEIELPDMTQAFENLCNSAQAASTAMIKFAGIIDIGDYKAAMKRQANQLNWKRPRGKKLSWRHLTRIQRQQAWLNWILNKGKKA